MDMESFNGTISDLNSGNILMNGNCVANEVVDVNGDKTEVSEHVKPVEGAAPTYADAFPPLSAAPATSASSNKTAWGQKNPSNKIKQPAAASKTILSSSSSQV